MLWQVPSLEQLVRSQKAKRWKCQCQCQCQPSKVNEVKKNDDALTEDDQIMIRMKEENASRPWQEIIDATSFTDVGLAKARWKEIEPKKDQPAATEKEPDKNESKKSKKDKKKHQDAGQSERINKDREEGLKRQAELKAAANATCSEENQAAAKVDKVRIGGRSPGSDIYRLTRDQDKPVVESTTVTTTTTTTNDLKDQADKYDRKKWQAMASKHYDKTGTRITATQAQKLAEGS